MKIPEKYICDTRVSLSHSVSFSSKNDSAFSQHFSQNSDSYDYFLSIKLLLNIVLVIERRCLWNRSVLILENIWIYKLKIYKALGRQGEWNQLNFITDRTNDLLEKKFQLYQNDTVTRMINILIVSENISKWGRNIWYVL